MATIFLVLTISSVSAAKPNKPITVLLAQDIVYGSSIWFDYRDMGIHFTVMPPYGEVYIDFDGKHTLMFYAFLGTQGLVEGYMCEIGVLSIQYYRKANSVGQWFGFMTWVYQNIPSPPYQWFANQNTVFWFGNYTGKAFALSLVSHNVPANWELVLHYSNLRDDVLPVNRKFWFSFDGITWGSYIPSLSRLT